MTLLFCLKYISQSSTIILSIVTCKYFQKHFESALNFQQSFYDLGFAHTSYCNSLALSSSLSCRSLVLSLLSQLFVARISKVRIRYLRMRWNGLEERRVDGFRSNTFHLKNIQTFLETFDGEDRFWSVLSEPKNQINPRLWANILGQSDSDDESRSDD